MMQYECTEGLVVGKTYQQGSLRKEADITV